MRDGAALTLPFDALTVCSGGYRPLMPVPGRQRAGCYSLGAAHIALKARACSIGTRTIFLGSGPLLNRGHAIPAAGAQVAAVLDTSPAVKSSTAVCAVCWHGRGWPGGAWR